MNRRKVAAIVALTVCIIAGVLSASMYLTRPTKESLEAKYPPMFRESIAKVETAFGKPDHYELFENSGEIVAAMVYYEGHFDVVYYYSRNDIVVLRSVRPHGIPEGTWAAEPR